MVIVALLVPAGCYRGHDGLDGETNGAGPDDDAGPEPDEQSEAQCRAAADGRAQPLRRLGHAQYVNTIRSLVTFAAPDAAAGIMQQIAPQLAQVPADARLGGVIEGLGGYESFDQAVQQGHVDGSFRVAEAVGAALASQPGVLGTCADPSGCVRDFIEGFGRRVLRRPLSEDDVEFYMDVFDGEGASVGADPAGIADVITVMLASPEFLYMVEHGAEPVPDTQDTYWLDDYELAARLSYHFWQTTPDTTLLHAAEQGELRTDEGYQQQVDRLFADARTEAALGTFFTQWLWLDDVPAVDALVGTPRFDAFADGLPLEAHTRDHMVDEVLDLARHYTFTDPGTFDAFFASPLSMARTDDLAAIYGVAPWDGVGDPPVLDDRAGLLTRAALLATGTVGTRPVMKGAFIRAAILCDPLPPPPPDAGDAPPPDGQSTSRELIEALTEVEGTSCAGCHTGLLNPLGFATENFDGLGRSRTEEVFWDAAGNELGREPVDTRSQVQVVPGDPQPSAGVDDLTEIILDSGRAQTCFAQNYIRFTFGRPHDQDADACVLEQLTLDMADGATMAQVLQAVALRPEFRQRTLLPGD